MRTLMPTLSQGKTTVSITPVNAPEALRAVMSSASSLAPSLTYPVHLSSEGRLLATSWLGCQKKSAEPYKSQDIVARQGGNGIDYSNSICARADILSRGDLEGLVSRAAEDAQGLERRSNDSWRRDFVRRLTDGVMNAAMLKRSLGADHW